MEFVLDQNSKQMRKQLVHDMLRDYILKSKVQFLNSKPIVLSVQKYFCF